MDFDRVQSQTFGNAFVDHKTTALDYSATEQPPYLFPLLCNPTDWTLSTAQPWQQSPFTESSVSLSTSGGVYSDRSWNPFDQSFATGQVSPGFEYKTESIHGTQSSGSDGNEELVNLTDFLERKYSGEPMKLEVSPAEPHHIFYRPLPRHAKSASKPKSKCKTKRSPKSSPQASASTPTHPRPNHTPSPLPPSRLSASPPSLHSPTSSTSQNTTKIKNSRKKVEKQYRKRLNDEFQSLLQALPQDSMRVEWKKSVGARVSKAEVLVLARERIAKLEEEGWCLEQEREILLKKIEEMKRRELEMRGLEGVNADVGGMARSLGS